MSLSITLSDKIEAVADQTQFADMRKLGPVGGFRDLNGFDSLPSAFIVTKPSRKRMAYVYKNGIYDR